MSGFLYFLLGVAHGNRAAIEAVGLGAIFGERNPVSTGCAARPVGPDGQPQAGCICAMSGAFEPGELQRVLKFQPEAQTWHEFEGYNIGFWNDRRPGPIDLRRKEFNSGHDVLLNDGNAWTIPMALQWLADEKRFDIGGTLPRAIMPGEGGQIMLAPKKEFEPLLSTAYAFMQYYLGRVEWGKDWEATARCAGDALAVNYHAGINEALALGLFDTVNVIRVLEALIDGPALKGGA